jgi:hexosaminidase
MRLSFLTAVTLILLAQAGWAATAPAVNLMPMPKTVVPGAGALRIDGSFRLAFAGPPTPRLERAGRRLIAQIARETGIPLRATSFGGINPATLVVDCPETTDRPDALGNNESYRLVITSSQARISAPTTVGAMRGMQTFLQLISPDKVSFSAPAMHIEDAPRFGWRGLLFDVTSHFLPVDVILRNLDAMEAVKLNVLHLHMTDDQGFRVESKVFPKLHQLGSDGDYYSQADIRRVLVHARDRGIRVIPELDLPGHCASILVGYPELGSAPGPYSIIHTFGIYDPTLDPTREQVYQFLDKLIGELAALFPDEYFHIGGDEVTGKHWKQNAGIQSYIRQHNLRDEAGLQAYFNRRVEALVKKHGKKMMGWDEVLHPGLPRDIMVQSWRDHESLAAAAKRGYRALLSYGYYLDHLKRTADYYRIDPLGGPANWLQETEAARIVGGEACMWTEFVSPDTIDSRTWPKAAAIAERLWSPAEVKDEDSMYERLDQISRRLDWRGVRHNSNYAEMLHRMAPAAPPRELRTLSDAVEPTGIEIRELAKTYSHFTPMNRLVDVARGESLPLRRLERSIREWLASPERAGERPREIRETLVAWRDNHRLLLPALQSSFLLKEAVPLSEDLADLAGIGLKALDYMDAREKAPEAWAREQLAAMDRMARPRIEVVLAAAGPVRMLVRAAAGLDASRQPPAARMK